LLHDVFICHCSEDKEDFVRPLAKALRAHHLDVWYDEFALTIGDSLREAIDRGLAESRFGIVVLSPDFFRKRWTQRELNGLVAREISEERQLILPIWHHINRDEIVRYSPPLADVFAASSVLGVDAVVDVLLKKIRPEVSPLIVARDFLINMGVSPPVVTDEWWLDVLEVKEAQLRFPEPGIRRWIFPLPYPAADYGRERGLNIGWTALQMDWASDGEERNLCQLTHPERVHDFLRTWPGFLDCARANPGILAMYTPQLTIPGYDNGLVEAFDALLDPARDDAYQMPGYGGKPETTDGQKPLCGELIAWRHPTFGNYTDTELACSFVHAHDGHYSRYSFSAFECLTWLLSSDADWMPQRLRDTLLEGTRKRDVWYRDVMNTRNAFSAALLRRTRNSFKFTREIRSGLEELFAAGLHQLQIKEASVALADRFIARGFVAGFYEERERVRMARNGRR
jgi:hypothetical protein